ncbi:hypothetical protein CBS147308_10126 [Penicillium roqueforti]|nr:hypothetical protein CBS147308_10126 [Penicillium roqueforti]
MGASDVGEERRLSPLPRILPLPSRGHFNPFNTKDALVPTTPGPQDTFQFKSPWAAADHIVFPFTNQPGRKFLTRGLCHAKVRCRRLAQ